MIGNSLEKAVEVLHAGGIVATPTEAVFGLSCDPDNFSAVKKLLALKERDTSKGFILISDTLSRLCPYISPLTNDQENTISSMLPKPVTWVVPKASSLPTWIAGEHDSIAIRVTGHPLAKALCAAFGKPLISTSANLSGQPPAKTAKEVHTLFTSALAKHQSLFKEDWYILDGMLGSESKPTQIRDLITGTILRQ